jgi:hypothetical protein
MFHDFEEIILGEAWLRQHGAEVQGKLQNWAPRVLQAQLYKVLRKSTAELALSVSLIYALAFTASLLAAVFGHYGFFIAASGMFFLHGFMHLGQAFLLRRYVPAVVSSIVIAIPYGFILFPRLLADGIVDLPGLLLYFGLAAVLAVPFILVVHKAGEVLYKQIAKMLVK